MVREQYRAVYHPHTVVAGHHVSDISRNVRTEVAHEPNPGAHLHGMILPARSTGLRKLSSLDQLGKN